MFQMIRCIAAAAAVLSLAAPLAAQGRADLRYAAPMPATVLITSTDTITSTMMGLPTGDMETTGTIRSVSELRFSGSGDSVRVTATLKELEGLMSTPMGNMPLTSTGAETVEMMLGPTGPDPEALIESQGPAALQGSPDAAMASQRAIASLMVLPGRQLALGETWTDTLHLTPTIETMAMDMTVITRGAYVADTVVNGRTLNVLNIVTETTMTMTGSARGVAVKQTMKGRAEEHTLWDSSQRVAVRRESTSTTEMDMEVPAQGMTLRNTARARNVITAELQQ